jgi:DNA-binding CsgD family transcriptional regulator
VKNYVTVIYEKLGVRGRGQLLRYAQGDEAA